MTVHYYNPDTDEIAWVLTYITDEHTWSAEQLINYMHSRYADKPLDRPRRRYYRPTLNIPALIYYMIRQGYFRIVRVQSLEKSGSWRTPKRRQGEQHFITRTFYRLI